MTFENDLRVRQQHSPLHFNAQSRYNDLIHATGTRYVVGIFFPALPGFSTYACLEQMATLPKGFILSGIATTAMAMAMWPQHLKHFNFLCPATHYELPTRSISFELGGETTTVIQPTESGIFATGLVRFCSGLIYIGDQH
jgi:hypothetical protein